MNKRVSSIRSVGVLGAGAVGTALAALFQDAGYTVEHICTRTPESLEASLSFLELQEEAGELEAGKWCGDVDLCC